MTRDQVADLSAQNARYREALELVKIDMDSDEEGGSCSHHYVSQALALPTHPGMEVARAMEKVVEAARNQHSLDQQTHGLAFGMSKENCKVCIALDKLAAARAKA